MERNKTRMNFTVGVSIGGWVLPVACSFLTHARLLPWLSPSPLVAGQLAEAPSGWGLTLKDFPGPDPGSDS